MAKLISPSGAEVNVADEAVERLIAAGFIEDKPKKAPASKKADTTDGDK